MSPHRETFGFAFDFQFNFIIAIITLLGCLFLLKKYAPFGMGNDLDGLMVWVYCFNISFSLDKTSYAYFLHTPLKLYFIICCLLVNTPIRIVTFLWIIALSLGYYAVSLGLVGILEGENLGISEQFGPLGTLFKTKSMALLT